MTETRDEPHDATPIRSPPVQAPGPASPTFVASCSNCVSFVDSACARGVVLDPGRLLCERYAITEEFRDRIVEIMMADVWKQVRVNAERVQKLQAVRRLWN